MLLMLDLDNKTIGMFRESGCTMQISLDFRIMLYVRVYISSFLTTNQSPQSFVIVVHNPKNPNNPFNPGHKKVGRYTSYFLLTICVYLFVIVKAHRFACSLQQFIFFLATYYHVFEFTQTCTCRDWVTGDHVLFQSE